MIMNPQPDHTNQPHPPAKKDVYDVHITLMNRYERLEEIDHLSEEALQELSFPFPMGLKEYKAYLKGKLEMLSYAIHLVEQLKKD